MFPDLTYVRIAADITSNCNLRCPFCLNDWRSIQGNTSMTDETFSRLVQLIPLAAPEQFHLSCLFEPIIHPDFVRLVQRIPSSGRSRVFFSTNLARRLPKETFQALGESNLHHVNISVESLEPSTYEELRRGARFHTFMDNLEELVSVFAKNPTAPRIRYISMVLKQNLGELPALARVLHEDYLADRHELRTPFGYSLPCMDYQWIGRSVISAKDWDDLVIAFSKLPYHADLINESEAQGLWNPRKVVKILKSRSKLIKIPSYFLFHFPNLGLRVLSDGTITQELSYMGMAWPKKSRVYNINALENPQVFFRRRLYRVYDAATWPRWRQALWQYLGAAI